MTYEEAKRMIIKATFSQNKKTLYFNELPQNETFQVRGVIYATGKDFVAECTLKSHGELLIDGEVYRFKPWFCKGVFFAVQISNIVFFDSVGRQMSFRQARRISKEGLIEIFAGGNVYGHYRIANGDELRTSQIERFYKIGRKWYFDTKNSTYCIQRKK